MVSGEHYNQQFGNYKLQKLLGRGGFAEVYLGEHIHLGTRAAIKVLYNRLAAADIENFKNEARMIARLVHPHIVRVLEFGIEGNLPFLVMHYAPGGSLRKLHPQGSRVPLPIVVGYVKQIAEALQYAHSQRVIHRDIKPDNMFLDSHSHIMLGDFGMALIAQSSRYQNRQEIAGTTAYMAPEQFQGKTQRRSDQYALAIVVYEWLCGDRPFHGTFPEIASQHFFTPLPSLCARVPYLPVQVEQVIFRALAKDPMQRFENVQDFAAALEEAARRAGSPPQLDKQSAPFEKASDDRFAPLPPMLPSFPEQIMLPTSPQQVVLPPPLSEKRTRPRARLGDSQTTSEIPSQQKPPLNTTDAIAAQQKPVPQFTQPTHATPFPPLNPLRRDTQQKKSLFASRRTLLLGSGATILLIATGITWGVIASAPKLRGAPIYTYHKHTAAINAISWSPNSDRIVSGSSANMIEIWDATTGAHSLPLPNPGNTPIICLAWSFDGKHIAYSNQISNKNNIPTTWLWDSNTPGTVDALPNPHTDANINAIAWSHDSAYLATADQGGFVQTWDVGTNYPHSHYDGHNGTPVLAVSWSPDGTKVASGGEGTNDMHIWDPTPDPNAANGEHGATVDIKKARHFSGHNGKITDIAWSPDGKFVASSSTDATVKIWDPNTGGTLTSYQHSSGVTNIAYSPDGKFLASGCEDSTVQIWDNQTGAFIYTYKGHTQQVNAVAWSPDGTMIASASSDATVQVWQAF